MPRPLRRRKWKRNVARGIVPREFKRGSLWIFPHTVITAEQRNGKRKDSD